MKSRIRRLSATTSLEQQVRFAVWVSALLAIAGTLGAVLGGRPSRGWLGGALLALAWLSWHWAHTRRTGRVHWTGDFLDAIATLPVAVASPNPLQVLSLLYSGAMLRSLYPGRAATLVRAVCCTGAVAGGVALASACSSSHSSGQVGLPAVGSALPGVVFVMAFTKLLAAALARGTRAADRDRLLADSGVRLLAAGTTAQVVREAEATARALVTALPAVQLRVLPPHGCGEPGPARPPTEAGRDAAPAEPDHLRWTSFGEHLSDGGLEVRGPEAALREVDRPLAVLAQQVGLALQKCAAQEELRLRADTDGLTGLANREVFRSAVDRAVVDASAGGSATGDLATGPLASVLLIDCDDFKQVNDTCGHLVGDTLLVEVAERLRSATGPGDLVARLGGDEFAVLLHPQDREDAEARVARLTDLLNGALALGERTVALRCSIGSVRVRAGLETEDVLHRADAAMYAAKGAGKGHHVAFDGARCDGRRGHLLPVAGA